MCKLHNFKAKNLSYNYSEDDVAEFDKFVVDKFSELQYYHNFIIEDSSF